MKWRVMLEQNGELERRQPRAAPADGALRDGRRLPASAPGRVLRRPVPSKDECGACDYCLGELEPAADPVVDRAEDPVVRRARRPAVRRDARRQRAARPGERAGAVARARPAEHVRPAAGRVERRSARLHRAARSALELLQQTDDVYPGAGADARRARAAEGRRPACPGSRSPGSVRRGKGAPRPQSRVEAESWQNVDRDLFERLRAVRLEIARSRGVPPYVIFHDATLREMARLRPPRLTRCWR